MNLVFFKNSKKFIAILCLFIYIIFSFLSNMGATLCFGTNLNRHIGLHALNYDSCPDGKICTNIQNRIAFSDYQSKFDFSNFQINLNKIISFNFDVFFQPIECAKFYNDFDIFEGKNNKINWDIYDKYNIKTHLQKLKTVVLIV